MIREYEDWKQSPLGRRREKNRRGRRRENNRRTQSQRNDTNL